MRKLVLNTFLSLDGVMQSPGGRDEDREGGFAHGGWSVSYWDEPMGETIVEWTQRAGALLLGRKTYEIFVAHWPKVSDEDPVAAKLNSMPKYVASRTLRDVSWHNARLITGDVAEAVRRLKDEPGDEIQVHGSCDLIQTLLRESLVDEMRLWIFPVVLGSGKRLFADGTIPGALKLVSSKSSSTGVTVNTYDVAGAIPYGTFEVDAEGRSEALWRGDPLDAG